MIRKDGHPFILDFGIAREIQETMTRITGKLSSGTLLYMSPEQLNGAAPKKEQDIYSFAAMAYECLKGEPPFVRGAIEDQIKNKSPEPLGEGHLCASIMSGLAKTPEDRPKSCTDLLNGDVFSRNDRNENKNGGAGRMILAVAALGLALCGGSWWWQCKQVEGTNVPVEGTNTIPTVIVTNIVSTNKPLAPILSPPSPPDNVEDRCSNLVVQCPPISVATTEVVVREPEGVVPPAKTPVDENPKWSVATNTVVVGNSFGCHSNWPCITITSPDKVELRLMWCEGSVDSTKGFWMGETEVTIKQWRCIMDSGSSCVTAGIGVVDHGEERPISNITYDECCRFMEKLDNETRLAFSLPDTNSWRIACLAGGKTAYWWGEDCVFSKPQGNFKMGTSDLGSGAMVVKSYEANAWGLYDTHGNVAEWCDGGYVCGGNYGSDAKDCNASSFKKTPDTDKYKSEMTGFRVFLKENGK